MQLVSSLRSGREGQGGERESVCQKQPRRLKDKLGRKQRPDVQVAAQRRCCGGGCQGGRGVEQPAGGEEQRKRAPQGSPSCGAAGRGVRQDRQRSVCHQLGGPGVGRQQHALARKAKLVEPLATKGGVFLSQKGAGSKSHAIV